MPLLLAGLLQQQSPFSPPRASMHYAPDRTCDLLNVDVSLDVDYTQKLVSGTVVNTLAPLRNGLTKILLHAGTGLTVNRVEVDGKNAPSTRKDRELWIDVPRTVIGKPMTVRVVYASKNAKGAASRQEEGAGTG